MKRIQAVREKYVSKRSVYRRFDHGFTLIEVTFTLLLIPLFVGLLVHFVSLGETLYEQPRNLVKITPQLIVRRIFDSRDCAVEEGILRGTYIRPDHTEWTWSLKQINRNMVMVGEEGGNLLFVRGIENYRVEPVGKGYQIRWTDSTGNREKNVMCMRKASLLSQR